MWRIGIECKMQQIFFFGGGGGGGIWSMWRLRIAATYTIVMYFHYVRKFHKMWNIGMKYVTYWYQFFTVWNLQFNRAGIL